MPILMILLKKILKNDVCVLSWAYIPNALIHVNNYLSSIRKSMFEIF